ncbi:hypothetical protein AB1K62_14540 [Parasphingorhabdus sp. JC815]|uniref:hypothetical protein n=1 Tax=Parasphingorhabdus sp. JC815 TaxID=3232140 RepID=UPI00345A1642
MSSRYRNDLGPNVEQILAQGSRVVIGKIPAQVRKELMAAVKVGGLGRLAKKGLMPEVFFHPDHKNEALERQAREAEYSTLCINKVVATKPAHQRVEDAFGAITKTNGGAA